jgi:hypothetical protein
MTCAYTVMTDGLLGNVRNSGLKEAFEHKHKKEARYYETYGIAPCLIRSKNYSKYIEQLKKELK